MIKFYSNSILEIFSAKFIIISIVVSIFATLLNLLMTKKFIQIAQQNGYNRLDYNEWVNRDSNVYVLRLSICSLLSVLGFIALGVALTIFNNEWVCYIPFAVYITFVILYYLGDCNKKDKMPLKYTKRACRLIVANAVVTLIIAFVYVLVINAIGFLIKENELLCRLRLLLICLLPMLIPFSVSLALIVTKPIENRICSVYKEKCKKHLSTFDNLIKIGITGSYGKTSVKDILKTILLEKCNVYATPFSYNTAMGICKSSVEITTATDVFIAEMGARKLGDIKELCEIVNPQYAIINGIIEQHMDTFLTLDNVKKTKFELVEAVKSGIVVISSDNENTFSFKDEINKNFPEIKVITAGVNINNMPDVFADNIEITKEGSHFVLNLNGRKIKATTSLLGKHNISNICLAAALADALGVEASEISSAISKLKPPAHRLQLVDNDKKVTIIDDSYNSNVSGTIAATETLSYFNGRKIVITPGLVELGKIQDEENYNFAKRLNSVANIVMVVGCVNAKKLQEGLIENGFDKENLYVFQSLDAANKKLYEILKDGDVILYENDLPDKFD